MHVAESTKVNGFPLIPKSVGVTHETLALVVCAATSFAPRQGADLPRV